MRKVLPNNKNSRGSTRNEYLRKVWDLVYLYFFLLLIFFARFEITSCRIPRGHTVEQYTLPNKALIIRITINPVTAKLRTWVNFIREGINWRKRIILIKELGIIPRKSIKRREIEIRKIKEIIILITLRYFWLINLNGDSIDFQFIQITGS